MTKIIKTCRQGFSLLEVLVSVFVVLIGLLGVATMIPAGRYEMLQARKADMGADLSRAVVNSVVTQLANGEPLPALQPAKVGYFVVANDNSNLSTRLVTGLTLLGFQQCSHNVNDNRTFNGNDDVNIMEDDNHAMQVTLDNSEAIGTGHYSAFATIVPMEEGYWEVTGLTVYRYNDDDTKNKNYLRDSYIFRYDDNTIDTTKKRYRWYKIENMYAARGSSTISTVAGDINSNSVKYLGEIVGVCRKVVRIGSYTTN